MRKLAIVLTLLTLIGFIVLYALYYQPLEEPASTPYGATHCANDLPCDGERK